MTINHPSFGACPPDRVIIFDTTLRDGEQSPGFSMTTPEKLRMAHALAALGVDVMEAGFPVASPDDFAAVHGIASGWVPLRAHLGGTSAGQAASLYLFTYYLGSAVFGTASGAAWTRAGWPGSVTLSVVLMLLVVALAVLLRRTPSLVPGVR